MKRYCIRALWIVSVILLGGCGQNSTTASDNPTTAAIVNPTQTKTLAKSGGETMAASTATELPAAAATDATGTPTHEAEASGPVRGIILFIGDGMGANQRLGAQWLAWGQEGQLAMDRMPVLGFQETSAADREVTDSGAAATALATGVKANYLAIGMDADYNSVETILEQAQARGWAVGLITTVPLAHATPAAFAAHVRDRGAMTEIAAQMMAHEIDVLLGGGEDDFLPGGERGCHPNNGHRSDGENLIDGAVSRGYTLVCSGAELLGVDTSSTQKLLGFFGDDEMYAPYNPSLAEMTQVAIEILSQDPEGFFLMVEGGQVDWAGHDNRAMEAMQFTVGLDAAVTRAQIYALGEPNVLVIVTADHETGGMSLGLEGGGSFRQDGPFKMPDGTAFWVDWAGGSHTGVEVPVTAQGPYSEYLAGEYPNTWIYAVMYAALTGEELVE